MEIASPREVKLKAIEATPESFAPFGQVISSSPDGDEFGPHDAQLDLSHGIPRSLSLLLHHSLTSTRAHKYNLVDHKFKESYTILMM